MFSNVIEGLDRVVRYPSNALYPLMQAPSTDIIDWMNFAVFLNAWDLNSHEISDPTRSTWNLANTLLRKYISETVNSSGPVISSPGSNLPFLVQLVTEPLAWHSLIIQSCVRSLHPSGKKKKKGGAIDQSNSHLSAEIKYSIQSLCDTIEVVTRWLKEQIQNPHDGKFEALHSSVQGNRTGPGKVFKILESSVSEMKDAEVGDRIREALNSWDPAEAVRKIVSGQDGLLTEFLKICESRIKYLQAIKRQL